MQQKRVFLCIAITVRGRGTKNESPTEENLSFFLSLPILQNAN